MMKTKLLLIIAFLFNCQLSIVNCQSNDTALMAAAARAEGLDKSAAFQRIMEAYRQQMTGKYLFDEQLALEQAQQAFGKALRTQGNRQLLVRQIFHALPQHVRQAEINQWQQRMDSISRALARGADFETLMNRYSDVRQAVWITRLDVTAEIEEVAFALRPGQTSSPFLSPQGIHILQVLDQRQQDANSYNTAYLQQIKAYAHPNQVTERQIAKLKQTYGFSENQQAVSRLYQDGKVDGNLFTLDGQTFTGAQFARFAQTYPLGVRRQYAAFVTKCVLDCDARHLESNPSYAEAMESVADKLLAQEAYRLHVEVPSRTDVAGLRTYFISHQKDYRWSQPRFRGAVIHAANKKTAKKVRKIVKKLQEDEWMDALQMLDAKIRGSVKIEQGEFAYGTNAFVDALEFGGAKAQPLQGYPVTLTVGKKFYGPDDYHEVLPKLQQDYKQFLANKWLSTLRKQK